VHDKLFAKIIARFPLCFKTCIPSKLVLKLRGSIKNGGTSLLLRKEVSERHSSTFPPMQQRTTASLLNCMSSKQRTLLWWSL